MAKPLNERLTEMRRIGFWVRTKLPPYRAVVWNAPPREDGLRSWHGPNWLVIQPEGDTSEPRRLFGADVEPVGPNEWLTYHPRLDSPLCGWGRPRLPDGGMQYCPRERAATDGVQDAFCARHMTELTSSEGEGEQNAGEERSHAE